MKMSLEGSGQRRGSRSGEKLVGQGRGHAVEKTVHAVGKLALEGCGEAPALPWGAWLGAYGEGTVGKRARSGQRDGR